MLNMNWNICSWLFLKLFILGFCVYFANGCNELTAYDTEDTFESHSFFGTFDYYNYQDECWIITADNYLKSVKIWSDDFELQGDDICFYDYVKIYDGGSNSYWIDYVKYCGRGSWTLVSSGHQVYVHFNTDSSTTNRGFEIKYKEVDRSEYYDYQDSWDNQAHNLWEGLRWWHILLIVLGVIVLLIILCVVVVVLVVVCILSGNKNKGRVNAANTGGTVVMQQQGQQGQMMNQGAYYNRGTGGVMVQPPAYSQQGGNPPGYVQSANPQYQAGPYSKTAPQQQPMAGGYMAPQQQQMAGGYMTQQQPAAQQQAMSVSVNPASSSGPDDAAYPPPAAIYNDPGVTQ